MRYLALLLFLLFVIPSSAAGGVVYPEMMFVLDGSGSMWGKIGTETKIEAAKRVMHQAVPALPSEVKIGLTTYGHNRKGDCDDIEVLVPVGAVDRNGLLARVEAISPRGKTPIAASLRRITEQLKNKEEETTIVLVSDGEETCDSDPCGAVKALKEAGLKFILHVVGFGVNSMQSDQLACLAREGGGSYFGADDGGALLAALATVGREVGQKVEKARTAVKKNSTKLGKLQVTIPEDGLECLNSLKIVRKKDGKLLRTVEDPRPNATFPLLDGEYELVAGYANSNYKPDSEVTLGTWIVRGGETTVVPMGLLRVNIADPLKEMPTGAVIVNSVAQGFELVTPYNDNPYFLYKPKPVPPGEYTFSVHYKLNYLYQNTPETPVSLAGPVSVAASKSGTVTIDSGIKLKKAAEPTLSGWELKDSGGDAVLKVGRAFNGDWPLWQVYAVRPGTYQLDVWFDGAEEALPVADSLDISSGDLLEFDTGL